MIFAVILFFVLVVWVIIRANSNRGKTFVQSFYYLSCLESGKSAKEANYLAHEILMAGNDPEKEKCLARKASDYAQENFNGKQLLVIRKAASKGFIV